MLSKLLPKDVTFFDFFEQHAAVSAQSVREFIAMCKVPAPRDAKASRVKELEHEADVLTHRCVEALHKTFITPFDRFDIHQLISRMDDVVDYVEATTERILLYGVTTMRPEIFDLADVLLKSVEKMQFAVRSLRDMGNAESILAACVEINQLENEADSILRNAIARLFREETNAIEVIKWKEIFENLETATDRCEDVAQVLEGVVLEHA